MINEYGEELDRNGYAASVVQKEDDRCILCGTQTGPFPRHEIFHGANRQKSKRLGLWVWLCPDCHMRVHHMDASMDRRLKKLGQTVAMEHYGWTADGFIRQFGRNYLEEE